MRTTELTPYRAEQPRDFDTLVEWIESDTKLLSDEALVHEIEIRDEYVAQEKERFAALGAAALEWPWVTYRTLSEATGTSTNNIWSRHRKSKADISDAVMNAARNENADMTAEVKLEHLGQVGKTLPWHEAQLLATVVVARKREIPYISIGDALHISRQAAQQRFAGLTRS